MEAAGGLRPAARMKHSSVAFGRRMYVFGGVEGVPLDSTWKIAGGNDVPIGIGAYEDGDKSSGRIKSFSDGDEASIGNFRNISQGKIYGDFWEMDPGILVDFSASRASSDVTPITQGQFTFSRIDVDPPHSDQMCVEDIDVEVHIEHSCAKELVVSLMGPGSRLGDDTDMRTETVLFHRHDSVNRGTCGAGLFSTRFDDHADVPVYDCCHSPFEGSFRPWDALRKYHGHEARGRWTLKVYDAVDNENIGTLISWKLHFKLFACEPEVRWRKLPSGPPPRHSHSTAVVDGAMFVYGGYQDGFLEDMWRYDFGNDGGEWTELNAVSYRPSRIHGASVLMTPWGILSWGGYDASRSSFDRKIQLYDAVEKTTRFLTATGQGSMPTLPRHRAMNIPDAAMSGNAPPPRSWHSAIVYDSATVKSGRHSSIKVKFHDRIQTTNGTTS